MVPTSRLDLFVGRDREMAEVRAALEDALAGRGGLVMLVGEPGIGKTRTAEELAAGARRRGAEVLWGNCPEERGAPPYWPWVQVIRTHVASASPEVLRAELGKSAGVIVEAVPEMVDLLPGVDPAPRLEDMDAARFRLFETVSSFIRRAASTRPVVIVLDNLHWADASSLRLLEYVAQAIEEARLLIVCIYRDTGVDRSHPLLRSLGELTRQRRFVRVLLRGLVEEETCRVMENVGGFSPPAKLVADVQAQTEGNPLFVREVMRLLAQEGMLDPQRMADLETWRFRIPEGGSLRKCVNRQAV
ncbi:MAG: AAA family ATPase [Chloroflexi bacterium]|nr:AAA family ATPase [Chloroflexota bacterium]